MGNLSSGGCEGLAFRIVSQRQTGRFRPILPYKLERPPKPDHPPHHVYL